MVKNKFNSHSLQAFTVRAVLYSVLRFIKCPGNFEILIAFKNEKDHVINKIIDLAANLNCYFKNLRFHSRSVKMNFKAEQFFNTFIQSQSVQACVHTKHDRQLDLILALCHYIYCINVLLNTPGLYFQPFYRILNKNTLTHLTTYNWPYEQF